MRRKIQITAFLIILFAVATPREGQAQNWSMSVNLPGYLYLGTLNVEGSFAVSQHISIHAGVKYNPWSFNTNTPEKMMQAKQQTFRGGLRFWPWNIYSGWWISGRIQYQEYNRGGILSPETEEGDAFGLGLSAGHTFMLHKNLNLELGLGFWGGHTVYTSYSCPRCGRITDSGRKWFILPDDLIVSLAWIF